MIKVTILDDTGHTDLEIENVKELKEKLDLTDKFIFFDGRFVNVVSLDGITEIPQEIIIMPSIIGG